MVEEQQQQEPWTDPLDSFIDQDWEMSFTDALSQLELLKQGGKEDNEFMIPDTIGWEGEFERPIHELL